ncbi:hypothetical protein RBU61_16405 [Tissierella sp. MB52-C2]|uniref:hypothetical protein n=1 Tax=Tissierella sp. MB52-C2 TaxID=3070999 RepID=UPI00280B664E|nr:hypothetical protein [Tissierella sp. MB52-C2]WMM24494.1 hypothetical protein RBU61_16405 [Tissierella sp. MB52-C2]
MKLVKFILIGIIFILIFNALGMFNPETSEKVDNAVETVKIKISEFKYKDKPLIDMSLKELSSNISSDINYLKEEIITEEGVKLSGKGLSVIINPTKDIILNAKVDATESKAVESIEKLLYNLVKKEIKVPDEFLEKSSFTVIVEKTDGEYNVKFNE